MPSAWSMPSPYLVDVKAQRADDRARVPAHRLSVLPFAGKPRSASIELIGTTRLPLGNVYGWSLPCAAPAAAARTASAQVQSHAGVDQQRDGKLQRHR